MKKFAKNLLLFLLLICFAAGLHFGKSFIKKYIIYRMVGVYYVFKGDRAYHKHKLAYSIEYYRKGLEYFPEHYTAWYNLGNIYVVYEDFFSAVDAYEQAIEHNPKYTMARMNLGIIEAEKLGNFEGAIEQYDYILNLRNKKWAIPFLFSNKKSSKQNKGLAYYNRGLAYKERALYLSDEERDMEEEYLREAAESYEKSHKILKKNSDVVYNLAITYHLLGDYRSAGMNYCKAIKLTPMNYEAHYNLSILLRRLKRYKDSLEELEKSSFLLALAPGDDTRAVYVFGVLNDVSSLYHKYGATGVGAEAIDAMYNTDNQDVVLKKDRKKEAKKAKKHGDVILDFYDPALIEDKNINKAIIKNFSMCAGYDYFEHEDEYE